MMFTLPGVQTGNHGLGLRQLSLGFLWVKGVWSDGVWREELYSRVLGFSVKAPGLTRGDYVLYLRPNVYKPKWYPICQTAARHSARP